jgi:hypothetical protein
LLQSLLGGLVLIWNIGGLLLDDGGPFLNLIVCHLAFLIIFILEIPLEDGMTLFFLVSARIKVTLISLGKSLSRRSLVFNGKTVTLGVVALGLGLLQFIRGRNFKLNFFVKCFLAVVFRRCSNPFFDWICIFLLEFIVYLRIIIFQHLFIIINKIK